MKRNIKFVLCLLLFFVTSNLVYATGPYDGIWLIKWNGWPVRYATLHEHSDNSIVIVLLKTDESFWEAYLGRRDGSQVVANTIASTVSAQIRVNIILETTMEGELVKCEPLDECEFPPGTRFTGEKLW